MARKQFPSNVLCVAFAWSIIPAGEYPSEHALVALGVSVQALVLDCDSSSVSTAIVELASLVLPCWRIGTTRFSNRAAKLLSMGLEEEDACLADIDNPADGCELHTCPRVEPFAVSSDPRISEYADERDVYSAFLDFRRTWYDACVREKVRFVQVVGNTLVDAGWLLSLVSYNRDMPPPNWLYCKPAQEPNGKKECLVELPICDIEQILDGFLAGQPDLNQFNEYPAKLDALTSLFTLPKPLHRACHLPHLTAYESAFAYLAYTGCTSGLFARA